MNDLTPGWYSTRNARIYWDGTRWHKETAIPVAPLDLSRPLSSTLVNAAVAVLLLAALVGMVLGVSL